MGFFKPTKDNERLGKGFWHQTQPVVLTITLVFSLIAIGASWYLLNNDVSKTRMTFCDKHAAIVDKGLIAHQDCLNAGNEQRELIQATFYSSLLVVFFLPLMFYGTKWQMQLHVDPNWGNR